MQRARPSPARAGRVPAEGYPSWRWAPSYLATSSGSAPPSIIKQYVEQQGHPAANPARTPGACAARELRSLVMPCPPGAAGRGRSAGVGGGAACGDVAPRLTETDRTLQPAA